jgi:DnaJ-class molecular chaperone
MNQLLKLLVIGLAIYGAYALVEKYYGDTLAKPDRRPDKGANSAPPVSKAPTSLKVTCPTCQGDGKLIDLSGDTQVAYACPICRGSGGRTLRPGAVACSYCKGMGHITREAALTEGKPGRTIAQRCPMCNGIGESTRP